MLLLNKTPLRRKENILVNINITLNKQEEAHSKRPPTPNQSQWLQLTTQILTVWWTSLAKQQSLPQGNRIKQHKQIWILRKSVRQEIRLTKRHKSTRTNTKRYREKFKSTKRLYLNSRKHSSSNRLKLKFKKSLQKRRESPKKRWQSLSKH